MKDSRIGEALWSEWSGEGYLPEGSPSIVFFTEEHVDVEHEVVRRALASAIQRDGSVDSLGQAFKVLDDSKFRHGFAGFIDEDTEYVECDQEGLTYFGDAVDKIFPITWVEVYE